MRFRVQRLRPSRCVPAPEPARIIIHVKYGNPKISRAHTQTFANTPATQFRFVAFNIYIQLPHFTRTSSSLLPHTHTSAACELKTHFSQPRSIDFPLPLLLLLCSQSRSRKYLYYSLAHIERKARASHRDLINVQMNRENVAPTSFFTSAPCDESNAARARRGKINLEERKQATAVESHRVLRCCCCCCSCNDDDGVWKYIIHRAAAAAMQWRIYTQTHTHNGPSLPCKSQPEDAPSERKKGNEKRQTGGRAGVRVSLSAFPKRPL